MLDNRNKTTIARLHANNVDSLWRAEMTSTTTAKDALTRRLFHGTGVYGLAAIAQSNTLEEGVYWNKPGEPHGPRTSESFEAAATFIEYNMYWGEGGVIVLDRDLLEQDYPTVKYIDTVCDDVLVAEQEVAILTPKVVNLDRYLVSIVCDPAVIHTAKDEDNLQSALDECGWQFDHKDFELARQSLDALLKHPKLNAWVPESGFPHNPDGWLADETKNIAPADSPHELKTKSSDPGF